jgi:hypothetical protein
VPGEIKLRAQSRKLKAEGSKVIKVRMIEGIQRYNSYNDPNNLNQHRMTNDKHREGGYAGGTDFSLFGK